ncbi:BTAD domain-containing putative transcriptional regulator [Actinocatenispora sera]|uniref:AfsR/SARP family transcriptional regulator n=1 Tax=Actinocatenispora sera TaxID=390989 RepID=UPI0033E171BF
MAPAPRTTFGLLGPLRVRAGGVDVPVPGAKRRMVLAHLLLHANRVVSADELTATLWADDPPRTARDNLYTYLSGLRHCLPPGPEPARISTTPHGYQLHVADDELDAAVFATLLRQAAAHRHAGRWRPALDLLDEALRLWRGAPLADLPARPAWSAPLGRLTELRLDAREQHAVAHVRLGEHGAGIGELRELATDHPFRESLWLHLMTALAAAGRRADALAAYRQARDLLVGELGVEPGAALVEAHRAILAGSDHLAPAPAGAATPDAPDATLPVPVSATTPAAAAPSPATAPAAADPPSGVPEPPVAVPHQLPAYPADFVGRRVELDRLDALLRPDLAGPPTVACLVGMAGVGKTALAARAGGRVTDRFPDGQLYAQLHGSTDRPRGAGQVLGELLRALGVPRPQLPRRTAERAAQYRSLLAGRRVLVVLDDAAGVDQIEPLLPATGNAAVLVTCRRTVTTLPGAHLLSVPALTPDDARTLLARIVPDGRIEHDPAAAGRIARACGYLPLAVRLAGARLAAHPHQSVAQFAALLAPGPGRLDQLHADGRSVREALLPSLRRLPDDAVLAVTRWGLFASETQPDWVVRSLFDLPRSDRALDALVEANLLRPVADPVAGELRYRLPELLHCHATEAAGQLPPDERRGVAGRVSAGWLARAEDATTALPHCVFLPRPGTADRSAPGAPTPPRTAPLAWFDQRLGALVDAVDVAAAADLHEPAWELAVALTPYFDHSNRYDEWRRSHRSALVAARRAGNRHGEAALLRGLGQILLYQDRYGEARELLLRSYQLSRELGDVRGAAVAASGLGSVERLAVPRGNATRWFRRSLEGFVALGDENAQAQVHNNLGMINRDRGRYDQAHDRFQQALQTARRLGDRHREANVLREIGALNLTVRRPTAALRQLTAAVEIFDQLGDTHCAGYAIQTMGRVLLTTGDERRAHRSLGRALGVFRRLGDRSGEATAMEGLAEVYAAQRRSRDAASSREKALELRRQITGDTEATRLPHR